MAVIERGCNYCPYSGLCPLPVKENYGFTLVGPESYKLCHAYRQIDSPDKALDVFVKLESERHSVQVNI